jgi:hypothetical protein
MMNPAAVAAAISPRRRGHLSRAVLWTSSLLLLGLVVPAGTTTASISVPLDGCPRSEVSGGVAMLSAGLGPDLETTAVVDYGEKSILGGVLLGNDGRRVSNAFICIYARVTTDDTTELVGTATTDSNGRYEFSLPNGPSRDLTAVYESDQGQLTAWALLQVRASPTLRLADSTVQNKSLAFFSGTIPGPHNDGVVVVLQVKSGKGWRVFRRYSTRDGGRYALKYRFTQTFQPSTYLIRAQVAGAPGYPYLPGNSAPKKLRVYP